MCCSIFFAQVLGIYFFLVALAMLIHPQRFKKSISESTASLALTTISGGFSLLLGLFIVTSHNMWVSMWPVLITIIGWFLIITGVLRIFFPEHHARVMKDMMAKSGYTMMCWAMLLIGIYLIWAGFAS